MRYFVTAVGLAFALVMAQAAVAADGSATSQNGYDYYHQSNN
jgi:hypothetical protein